MKKILFSILLGWSAHWLWVETKTEMSATRLAHIKHKIATAASPKPFCGTTCLQKKLPSLESSLAEKKKELKTKIAVKEPSAEQLVSLGILKEEN